MKQPAQNSSPASPTAKAEMEALCTRIGAAVIACQIIERNLHRVLYWVFPDKKLSFEKLFKYSRDRPLFNEMIKELRTRVELPKEFAELLNEFRLTRNKFVHAMLDGEGADIMTHEGRMVCYQLTETVHAQADALNHIFQSIFVVHSDKLGLHWPDYLRPA